jgi:hypothetical protein
VFADKQKTAALILGKLSGAKPKPAEEGPESDGLTACMEDFIHAVAAKDASMAAEAFRRCVELGSMPEPEAEAEAMPESAPPEEA